MEYTDPLVKPVRKGYKFVGYYATRSDGTLEPVHERWDYGEDRTLCASWSAISYTIRYDSGVVGLTFPDDHVTYGVATKIKGFPGSRPGYRIVSWYVYCGMTRYTYVPEQDVVSMDFGQDAPAEDSVIELKPNWIGEDITIRFDANFLM